MKTFLTLLAAIILISYTSQAQITSTPYKCDESAALKKIISQATADAVSNPKIFLIGTMNGNLAYGTLNINITVDMKQGTSNVWVYSVKGDVTTDSAHTYALIKLPLVGFMTFGIPSSFITDSLPFTPTSPLGTGWKGIDGVYDSLAANSDFKNYIAANTDWAPVLLGLGVNTDMPLFDMNKPYWLTTYTSKGGDMTCIIQAETGATTCMGFTSVEDNQSAVNLSVSPNPASNLALIKIPASFQSRDYSLMLFDSFGNKVKNLFAPEFGETESVMLDTRMLTNGAYYIVYRSATGTYTLPLIVSR